MDTSQNLPSGCILCGKRQMILNCQGCGVGQYCSVEHQRQDWPNHESKCTPIKEALAKLKMEEDNLQNRPGNTLYRANPFENSVGNFWGIFETRDYMRARYALAGSMTKLNTYEGVEAATAHFMDMLRLCHTDNMGIRDQAPHLMLRLGDDQRAYDFAMWWAADYKPEEPFLNSRYNDAFESVKQFITKCTNFSHFVAITLIKLRMLKDLEQIENCRSTIGRKLPEELLNEVQSYALVSTIIHDNKQKYLSQDNSSLIKSLAAHVHDLFKAVDNHNQDFWHALVDYHLHDNLEANRMFFSAGEITEMQRILSYSFQAWKETPGAMEAVLEWI